MKLLGLILINVACIMTLMLIIGMPSVNIISTVLCFAIGFAILIIASGNKKNDLDNLTDEEKKKQEELYNYYMSDKGKQELKPYLSEKELKQDWQITALTYSTDNGQKLLKYKMNDELDKEDPLG